MRAHAGAEQAGLDRIAHHEESAERQRQPADPHHPAGAERLLEAGLGLRQRRRRRGRAHRRFPARHLGWRGRGRRSGFDIRDDVAAVWRRRRARQASQALFEGLVSTAAAAEPASPSALPVARIESSRARSAATWFERLARDDERDDRNRDRERNRTGCRTSGLQAGARRPLTGHVSGPSQSSECRFTREKFKCRGRVSHRRHLRTRSTSRATPDRRGTAGLRRSCCPDPSRRARAASVRRGPAPCRRG